jgi:hypothetical protein
VLLDDEIVLSILSTPTSTATPRSGAHGHKMTPRGGSAAAAGAGLDSSSSTATGNDSSVATSLSAQTGTVLRKVIAVLHVEFLPAAAVPTTSATQVPNFVEVLKAVAAVVADHHGEVAATTGSTVTVLFNARVSTSAAATRAVHTDEALRLALQPRGVRVVSAVATGSCLVATVEGRAMCVGAPMTRALRLHAGLVAEALGAAAPSPPRPMLHRCVVDGVSVEVVRQAFEVQCIGPFGVDGTLGYAVEREWEAADADADDEWLYRLQKMEEQSAFTALNAAFELLKANPTSDKARAAAAAVLESQPGRRSSSPQTAPLATAQDGGGTHPLSVAADAGGVGSTAIAELHEGDITAVDPYAVERLAAMMRSQ